MCLRGVEGEKIHPHRVSADTKCPKSLTSCPPLPVHFYPMSGPCCFSGHLATGTPTGEVSRIADLDVYVARPTGEKKPLVPGKAIILLADVFGWAAPNARLLADSFASETGLTTYVPDLFNGGAIPLNVMESLVWAQGIGEAPASTLLGRTWRNIQNVGVFLGNVPTIIGFISRHPQPAKIPLMEKFIAELKASHGITSIGTTGYCYGGTLGALLAQRDDLIQCFVSAHGKYDIPKDVEALKKPGYFISADNDFSQSESQRKQLEAAIDKRTDLPGCRHKFYQGTYHGFAVRGDERVPAIQEAKADAFNETAKYLAEYV